MRARRADTSVDDTRAVPEPTPAGLPAPTVSLLCPATRLPLTETTLADAEVATGSRLTPPKTPLRGLSPSGRVLLRSDAACAYPFHGDVPVALAPEALVPRG